MHKPNLILRTPRTVLPTPDVITTVNVHTFAVAAVIREDIGDNGKHDWLDSTIQFEVEALLDGAK